MSEFSRAIQAIGQVEYDPDLKQFDEAQCDEMESIVRNARTKPAPADEELASAWASVLASFESAANACGDHDVESFLSQYDEMNDQLGIVAGVISRS